MNLKIALVICFLSIGYCQDKSVKQVESTNDIEVEYSSLVLEFQQNFENAAKKWDRKRVTITGYMHATINSTPQSTFSLVPFLSMNFGGYSKFEVVRVSLKENASVPYANGKLTVSGLIDVGTPTDPNGLNLIKASIHEKNSVDARK